MNDLTREILSRILKDPKCWDKKMVEPAMSTLRHKYLNVREYLWLQKIYFPRYFRATRLLVAMGWPEDHFAWLEEDYASGWVITCDECGDTLQHRLTPYFEALWEAPGWELERFTKEDVLGLGVQPDPLPSSQTRRMVEHGQLQLL
jgi:hypothetical protein